MVGHAGGCEHSAPALSFYATTVAHMRKLAVEAFVAAVLAAGGFTLGLTVHPAAVSQTEHLYVCVHENGSTTPVLAYTPRHGGGVQCVRWKVEPVP